LLQEFDQLTAATLPTDLASQSSWLLQWVQLTRKTSKTDCWSQL